MAGKNQITQCNVSNHLDQRKRSRRQNESQIAEGLVISICRGNTSSKAVFVLPNDHTICSVFTQTVPGSLEETDSAPER